MPDRHLLKAVETDGTPTQPEARETDHCKEVVFSLFVFRRTGRDREQLTVIMGRGAVLPTDLFEVVVIST